jgi:SPP1 family predicted phage head-tail adaptor
MEAGKLRKRIYFYAPVANRDANGENIQTWVQQFGAWASIDQLRGSLLALAQAKTATATATHSITIRWNPQVVSTWRIQQGFTSGDFDTLTDSDFDALSDEQFDYLGDGGGRTPTIYTINSILDPDSRTRQQTILATVVRV